MFWKNVITKKDIQTLTEDKLEQKIIQFLNKEVKKSRDEYSFITSLPKGLQMFYSTWWLESEVNNGGFSQYFWNRASHFAKEAYYGYLTIGAKEYAKFTGEGMTIYVKNHPLIVKLQEKGSIEAYKDLEKLKLFDDLDKRFFDNEKKENVMKLRRIYINTYPQEFIRK